MDKQTIAGNFSRCASFYDGHTNIQKKAAKNILERMRCSNPSNILEIGCGTGHLTELLRKKYKKANISALDISRKMIDVAEGKLKGKGIEFITCDGEYFARENTFDLIASNACFQWFEDFKYALACYKKSLKKNGEIAFSFYGPKTFWELNSSFKDASKNFSVSAERFLDEDALKKLLGRNFRNVSVQEKSYTEILPSLLALLKKIKYSGVRGERKQPFSYNFGLLEKVESCYLSRFKEIKATHQIFICRGQK